MPSCGSALSLHTAHVAATTAIIDVQELQTAMISRKWAVDFQAYHPDKDAARPILATQFIPS